MPVFRITYTDHRTNHGIAEEVEWVTASDWDTAKTKQCFQARFPDAANVCIQQVPTCPQSSS